MSVVAITNQKGGVGKSTTAINLAAGLALQGERTLLVDLDPQGNATSGLGVDKRQVNLSIYDVLLKEVALEDAIEPTSVRDLFVVPATIDLAGAEIELVSIFSRELRLRSSLMPIRADFDVILIDCPPSLGLLTVNALAAADEVLIPIQCEYYALEGLSALVRTVEQIREAVNPDLEVLGILRTMFDPRNNLANDVSAQLIMHFGDKVFRTVIPRNVRLAEAPSYGVPVLLHDKNSRGAMSYLALASELSYREDPRPGA